MKKGNMRMTEKKKKKGILRKRREQGNKKGEI